MPRNGVQHTTVSYTTILAGMYRVGRVTDAEKFFDKMLAARVSPNLYTYNIILDGLCKNRCIDKAMKLFQDALSSDVNLNIISFTTLIDGLFKAGKINEAKNLFNGIPTAKDLKPTIVTYRVTVKGLIKEGLFDEFMTDVTKYISGCMASLSAMVQLELPNVNILSKMDLLPQSKGMGFTVRVESAYGTSVCQAEQSFGRIGMLENRN
ncbi:putative pentatricopeptide repeat-containing protein, mitochondrial [Cocos nucifera]|uniref:Putative pentatricopeptide repeat-containing protein, mitochondrial n=1 Tax=Cocos nucifera TaxID=13894 RepID=A0A8K0IKC7_COCNU|nr:putative pentatricopeptide repeat-containing protein, mitochondrial [Cocos nucifera]